MDWTNIRDAYHVLNVRRCSYSVTPVRIIRPRYLILREGHASPDLLSTVSIKESMKGRFTNLTEEKRNLVARFRPLAHDTLDLKGCTRVLIGNPRHFNAVIVLICTR